MTAFRQFPAILTADYIVQANDAAILFAVVFFDGSDHSVSANAGGMNEAMDFFSSGKGHMPRSGSTSQSRSNPPIGAGFRYNKNNLTTIALFIVITVIGRVTLKLLVTNCMDILIIGKYMQLLQLINPDKAKSNFDTITTTHASGMMICPSLIPDVDKWIIDTGASKHMGTQLKSQQDQVTTANVVSSTT
ncbi:hypothetical protein H5410_012366 [Solanum commersonii]|uniref:Uncharacterized protein n=1 Tax=Solanum commersonii TaxID=4109 RepID=A0A9J6ARZ4_SOLCO|nr:hypothetical protein H5410_012366 [Solanum commersonii]